MVKTEIFKNLWIKNLMKREHLEDEGVDGRIILKCPILNFKPMG
jgi:hypothetical protein